MQPCFFHQQAADLTVSDHQAQFAVGVCKHAGHGVATTRQIKFSVDLADAGFAQVQCRKQLGELHFAGANLCTGLYGWVTRVQADLGIQLAACQAKVEGV